MKLICQINLFLFLTNINYLYAKKWEGFIVGGVEVPITMYPFVVQVYNEKGSFCSGVIVSDRVILTAGHCVYKEGLLVAAEDFDVYVGSSVGFSGTKYNGCQVIAHPKYDGGIWYDISLISLDRKIQFGPKVQKAILVTNQTWKRLRHSLSVVGFGVTYDLLSQNAHLKATRMSVVPNKFCDKSQSTTPVQSAKYMFCLIGSRWTSDCHGDSGSAVVWRNYVVGTVSTGRAAECGSDVMPSMYQELYYFKPWIRQTIKKIEAMPCSSKKKVPEYNERFNVLLEDY